jgi:O-antigen ligase
MFKYRKYFIALLFISPFFQLILPGSIKEHYTFCIYGIPFFVCDLIYYLIFPFLLLRKIIITKELKILSLCFFMLIISNLFSHDYQLQRLVISSNFYFFGIFFSILRLKNSDFTIVKYMIIIASIFLSLQIILISFGFITIDTGIQYEAGNYVRRGTTAGPATFTGHILIFLVALICFSIKSDYRKLLFVAISFFVIFLTGTRGAMLAIAFSIILFLWKSKILNKKNSFQIIISVALLFVLGSYLNVANTIIARNNEAERIEGGVFSGRSDRVSDSIDFFLKNWKTSFLGVGGAECPYYDFQLSEVQPKLSPHNIYISFLVENGIMGFLLLLILVCILFKKLLKTNSVQASLLISVLLFSFNTEVVLRNSVSSVLFWTLYFFIINNYSSKNIE